MPQNSNYSYYHNDVKIYNWTQALSLGAEVESRLILRKIESQKPNTCCNIVFTSGLAGDIKGAMLSHDNMTWFWQSYNEQRYPLDQRAIPEELHQQVNEELKDPIRMVSFLPLSHVTAQMADFSRLLISRRPVIVNFGEPEVTGTRIHELLKVVKPTELIAVPRVYEKWQSFIKMKMRSYSGTFQ